jgi:RNA polymerase sigma factor (sigma-70 family)
VAENKSEIEDVELIKRCMKDDRLAQKALFKKYYSYGMSICDRYIDEKDEVSWVLSNGFLKVFENLSKFDLSKPMKPWLKVILVNTCYTFLKLNKKHKYENVDVAAHVEDSSVDFQADISYEELLEQIKTLPNQYRTVFNLYVIDGYNHIEIGKMLGISEGTSKSNLFKAKEKLKEKLKDKLGIKAYEY